MRNTIVADLLESLQRFINGLDTYEPSSYLKNNIAWRIYNFPNFQMYRELNNFWQDINTRHIEYLNSHDENSKKDIINLCKIMVSLIEEYERKNPYGRAGRTAFVDPVPTEEEKTAEIVPTYPSDGDYNDNHTSDNNTSNNDTSENITELTDEDLEIYRNMSDDLKNYYKLISEYLVTNDDFDLLTADYEQNKISSNVYSDEVKKIMAKYNEVDRVYNDLDTSDRQYVDSKHLQPRLPKIAITLDSDLDIDASLDERIAEYNKYLVEYKEKVANLEILAQKYRDEKIAYDEYEKEYKLVNAQYLSLKEEYDKLSLLILETPVTNVETVKYSMENDEQTILQVNRFKTELDAKVTTALTLGDKVNEYRKKYEEYETMILDYNRRLEELVEKGEKFQNGQISYDEYKVAVSVAISYYNYLKEARHSLEDTRKHDLNTWDRLMAYSRLITELKHSNDKSVLTQDGGMIFDKNGTVLVDLNAQNPLQGLDTWDKDKANNILLEVEKWAKNKENIIAKYRSEAFPLEMPKNPEDLIVKERKIEKENPSLEEPTKIDYQEEIIRDSSEPIVEPTKTAYTYRDIYLKVMHGFISQDGLGKSGRSKFTLSNIKVHNSLQLSETDKRGGAWYVITSSVGKLFGTLIQGGKKITYKVFTGKKKKEIIAAIKERVEALTDEEVEAFILQINDAGNLRGEPDHQVFLEAMVPRINQYYMQKIEVINNKILVGMQNLIACRSAIKKLEEEKENKSLEEQEKIQTAIDKYYESALENVLEVRKLRKEGNKLATGDGLHAVEEVMTALKTKNNRKGMFFSKAKSSSEEEIIMENEQQKIVDNPSKSNKERVDAFWAFEDFQRANDIKKRSIVNLGSLVDSGSRNYTPFVETLYYGKDPLFGQIVSTVMAATIICNAVQTISKAIEQAEYLESSAAREAQIAANNDQIFHGQNVTNDILNREGELTNTVRNETVRTYGEITDAAERGLADQFGYSWSNDAKRRLDQIMHDSTAKEFGSAEAALAEADLAQATNIYEEAFGYLKQVGQRFGSYNKSYAAQNPAFDYSTILARADVLLKAGDFTSAVEQLNTLFNEVAFDLNYNQLVQIAALDVPAQNLASELLHTGVTSTILFGGTAALGKDKGNRSASNYDSVRDMEKQLYPEEKKEKVKKEKTVKIKKEKSNTDKTLKEIMDLVKELYKKDPQSAKKLVGLLDEKELDEPEVVDVKIPTYEESRLYEDELTEPIEVSSMLR